MKYVLDLQDLSGIIAGVESVLRIWTATVL